MKTTTPEPTTTTTVQGLALLRALEKLLIVGLEIAPQVDDRQGSGSLAASLNQALTATRRVLSASRTGQES